MSIRSILRAALSAVARLVVLPVEIVVNGIRMVIQTLVPARNTGSLDMAEEIVGEDSSEEALQALTAAREARRAAAQVRRSEPERVRMAAQAVRRGQGISRLLFNPAVAEEKEVIEWMTGLDQLHLGHLVNARDSEIEAHLAGERRLPIPLLPADEKKVEEDREAKRIPTEIEWVQILINRRVENGDSPDGDQMDDIIAEARQLAESNARVGDHLPCRVRRRGEQSFDEAA